MASNWIELPLEALKAQARSAFAMGPFGSKIKAENFKTEGVPVIKGGNLNGTYLNESGFDFLTQEKANELESAKARKLDIVITHRGTLGQVGIIPEDSKYEEYIVSQSQLKMSFDIGKVDPYFVYYFLKSPLGQSRLLSNVSQVGVPAIAQALSSVRAIEILMPECLSEQMLVSKILRNFDEKIGIIRGINKTLESIAQALFKSWFVDFDPVKAKIVAKQEGRDLLRAAMSAISGRTDVELDSLSREQYDQLAATAALFPDEMEESELGEIPRGWTFKCAEALSEVGIGKTPPRKEPQWFTEGEGDWRWVSIKDMGASRVFQQKSSEFLTEDAVSRFNVRVVPDRTVLLSFKLTIGRVAITDGPMVTNEAIAHFKLPSESEISSEYLYLYLKGFNYLTLGSTSSIADAVNSKTIREMRIIVANRNLVDRFTNSVAPIFEEIQNRQNEIASLETIRDALLPKLLSGELSIIEAIGGQHDRG